MTECIEREAYTEYLASRQGAFVDDYGKGWSAGVGAAKSIAEKFPAADVAPVVHGRWRKYSSDEWICTHCGYDKYCDTLDGGVLPPFCEECGARMDGE